MQPPGFSHGESGAGNCICRVHASINKAVCIAQMRHHVEGDTKGHYRHLQLKHLEQSLVAEDAIQHGNHIYFETTINYKLLQASKMSSSYTKTSVVKEFTCLV